MWRQQVQKPEREEGEEATFAPLRKKLKSKATGQEDNFVSSYLKTSRAAQHMSFPEAEELRTSWGIEIDGEGCPNPIRLFADIDFHPAFLAKLDDLGIKEPTSVQAQGIPCMLSGRDLLVVAETGSGKTLAYVLPMFVCLETLPPHQPGVGPRALVMAPTRELVEQIYRIVVSLNSAARQILPPHQQIHTHTMHTYHPNIQPQFYPAAPYAHVGLNYPQAPPSQWYQNQHSYPEGFPPNICPPQMPHGEASLHPHTTANQIRDDIVVGAEEEQGESKLITGDEGGGWRVLGVCGGIPYAAQIGPLKAGVDIVLATPGRLLDLCSKGHTTLSHVRYLVMDEVDRMLDMGMEVQLRQIIELATSTIAPRQTSLWSATIPHELDRLARSALLNPISIYCVPERAGMVARHIVQSVQFAQTYQKPKFLLEALRTTPYPPVMVFCNTIRVVEKVTALLRSEQFHAACIHSEQDQQLRFKVMAAFKNGRVDVLVSTDLASRGIDVADVTHVINYDMPGSIADYVHRCGRTGRNGRPGTATSFLGLDCVIAQDLKDMLEITGQKVPSELQNPKQFGRSIVPTDLGDRVV